MLIDKVYTSAPATRALYFETQIHPERTTRDLFRRFNVLRSIAIAVALAQTHIIRTTRQIYIDSFLAVSAGDLPFWRRVTGDLPDLSRIAPERTGVADWERSWKHKVNFEW